MKKIDEESKLLLVNYHYIKQRGEYKYPGIYPIEWSEFENQLIYLKERFHMAKPEEVVSFMSGQRELPGPSVFLTFDDGLLEHAKVALDLLDRYQIKGAFFICSRPYMDKKPLTVHKIHWLRATTPPEQFRNEFLVRLPDEWHGRLKDAEMKKRAESMYIYDEPAVAWLKYLMNFEISPTVIDEITESMMRDKGITPEEFCEKVYMTKPELKQLAIMGHIIGSHGHSHVPFSRLKTSVLEDELEKNKKFIEGVTKTCPTWLSYPYGRSWAIPDNEEEMCKKLKYDVAVSLVPGWNTINQNPYMVRRINTNDVEDYCSKVQRSEGNINGME